MREENEVSGMAKKQLHPSVQKFKQFVKEHPGIIREVREGKATWQELFEEWYLLGEDDPRFLPYKKEQPETKTKESATSPSGQNLFNTIVQTLKNMDMNQLQTYVTQLHDALGSARNLLNQLQGENDASQGRNETERRPNPFSFRKD